MGKFKVGDKVKVLDKGSSDLENGDIGVVKEFFEDCAKVFVEGKPDLVNWVYVRNLKSTEPSKKQRIEALEKRVGELELIVHELRGRKQQFGIRNLTVIAPSTEDVELIEFEGNQYRKVDRLAREGDVVVFRVNETFVDFSTVNKSYLVIGKDSNGELFKGDNGTTFHVYSNDHKRTPETVDVYESIVEDKPFIPEPVKTPNQLRAEIIEKAKGFVKNAGSKDMDDDYWVNSEDGQQYCCKVEFVVSKDKRKIVALMRGVKSGKVRIRGIAKCNPSDVFNEHIGKAIALGRALGLDVSEFEGAVQPTLAVGQIVQRFHVTEDEFLEVEFVHGRRIKANPPRVFIEEDGDRIINDTNAIYGEVE